MKNNDNNIIRYSHGERDILYSPIARCMAVVERGQDICSHPTLQALTEYVPMAQQKRVRKPEDYTLLTILPNNTCNFACSYCYSAAGRNRSVLDVEKMTAAIDYFIDTKPEGFSKALSISFMGGGEPMLSWENVKQGILHAKQRAVEKGLRLNISVITNGSIANEECILFFLQNRVNVSVSFEILEDVQNAQRKNFDLVRGNIRRLCEANVPVQINATITPLNVDRMQEMLATAMLDFPKVDSLMFEPATGEDIYGTTERLRQFYAAYLDGFGRCLAMADEHGISLTSFALLRTVFPIERACPGELCVTADGYISGCYCVGSPREPLFEQTQYGQVKGGHVLLDIGKFEALIGENVYTKAECKECEARWNCGGGCYHQYHSYSPPLREEVCLFTRAFVEMVVKHRVERHLRRHPDTEYPILIKI